jgi:hypothetical protein
MSMYTRSVKELRTMAAEVGVSHNVIEATLDGWRRPEARPDHIDPVAVVQSDSAAMAAKVATPGAT